MGLAHSLEDDIFVLADNDPRSVTVFRRDSAGDPDSLDDGTAVTGVVREDLAAGTLSAQSGAVLPQGSAAFNLQAKQLGYAAPSPGDVVRDDTGGGQRYSIDSVSSLGEGTWYRAVGVPEVTSR